MAIELPLVLAVLVALASARTVQLHSELRINTLAREIDATTQLVKESQTVEIENTGSRSLKEYVISIGPEHATNVAYVQGFKAGAKDGLPTQVATVSSWEDKTKFFVVDIGDLRAGAKMKLEVMIVYSHLLSPFPTKISQAENQNVVLEGSASVYSPYFVVSQKTTIKLASSNVHSYSKDASVTPASVDASTVTYGAYSDVDKFTWKGFRVHSENNAPFLTITRLERLIEVSHWGNIAVEETIDIYHSGAKLKGSFSRLDFQRDNRQSAPVVKTFRTLLPASAVHVYYRDEIGNISTSSLRENEDSVEIEVRPRFPLYGGWKTHYTIGYNVPSYVYLFRKAKNFALKMRFVDLTFDNFVADEVVTKIILPERTSNIKLHVPYDVEELPRETHYTFLDYTGRPVVSARKRNVVDNHIQDFTLEYSFDASTMLIEPLMVVAAFMALFLCVLVYVRLDFTIAKDVTSEARLKVAGTLDNIRSVLDDRAGVYDTIVDAMESSRTKKDLSILQAAKKKSEAELKRLTQQFSDMLSQLRQDNVEVAERLNDITRLDRQVRDQLNVWVTSCERLLAGKVTKAQFNDTEKISRTKVDESKAKIDKLVDGV